MAAGPRREAGRCRSELAGVVCPVASVLGQSWPIVRLHFVAGLCCSASDKRIGQASLSSFFLDAAAVPPARPSKTYGAVPAAHRHPGSHEEAPGSMTVWSSILPGNAPSPHPCPSRIANLPGAVPQLASSYCCRPPAPPQLVQVEPPPSNAHSMHLSKGPGQKPPDGCPAQDL